jgi:hypothetical protein
MLNNVNNYIIQFRNFYKTQTQQVIVVEKDKQIIKNNWYIWPIQILLFLNLTNVIEFFNFNYLYNIDNIYFYNDIKSPSIVKLYSSIIIEFLYNGIDITDIIKKYHIDVPLYIILDLENLEANYVVITIKLLNLGKIKINTYNDFNEIKFKKLSELI